MAIAIKIPDIGTTTSTVRLVRWLKREGDSIKRGDFKVLHSSLPFGTVAS